ncbi:hypothetical protein BN2497_6601 [Janthinobacterium sp. CG23_2]|nr:hypothetical protein BN2497_6601 [Janthinobacterium sp. CG23_2]CUU29698.1 hypothetical protein BN3177_6601 [Janthinobacterium sp. CG23_2]
MISLMFGLTVSAAQAAKMDGAPAAPCEGLKVATGPAGKGYSKLYADLVRVSKNTMPLCEVNTEGGLDNLTTLSIKKADVGIVPMDALKKMAEGDANIASLMVVAALNSNYLHIVTSANGLILEGPKKYGVLKGDTRTVRITRMSELRGAPVALVGSAQLMVRQLDKVLGYNMRYIDVDSDAIAFQKVLSGEAYAAFSVAGRTARSPAWRPTAGSPWPASMSRSAAHTACAHTPTRISASTMCRHWRYKTCWSRARSTAQKSAMWPRSGKCWNVNCWN